MGTRHPYLDSPPPLAFAHRGGAACSDDTATQIENTLAAFERAVELGYRYVETDVHATADGVPVMIHDARLERLTGRPGRVAAMTWADLSALRVGGAAMIPRLEEVLDGWPQVRFNIDVKADSGVEPAVSAIRRVNCLDRVLLASFSDARLVRLRAAAGPAAASSLGIRGVTRLRLASLAGRAVRLAPGVVAAQVPVRYSGLRVVDRRFVRYAHQLGLQVHVWTIDDPAEIGALLDLGVDGIMTDRVDVLRDVYVHRGLWTTA